MDDFDRGGEFLDHVSDHLPVAAIAVAFNAQNSEAVRAGRSDEALNGLCRSLLEPFPHPPAALVAVTVSERGSVLSWVSEIRLVHVTDASGVEGPCERLAGKTGTRSQRLPDPTTTTPA